MPSVIANSETPPLIVTSTDPLARQRLDMRAAGWEPLPDAGKACYLPGWSTVEITDLTIMAWSRDHPDWTNTGVRCGRIVPIDNDVLDLDLAAKVDEIVERVLGPTAYKRLGRKPVALRCYYNDTPIRKITITGGPGVVVEILGPGQQFAAIGDHPDTGEPYEWPEASPLMGDAGWMPRVTPDALRQLAYDILALFRANGYPDAKITGDIEERTPRTASAVRGDPICVDNVVAVMRHVSPEKEYPNWFPDVASLRSTNLSDGTEDDLLEICISWSRGDYHGGPCAAFTAGGEEEEVIRVWDSLKPDVPNGRGVGSLIKQARENGYRGPTGTKTVLNRFEGADRGSFAGPAELVPGGAGEAEADPDVELARRVLPAYDPVAGATRPMLEFWDDAHLVPMAGSAGRIGLLVAPSHGGKSTIEIAMALDACLTRGARILFCAGEGADDIMAQQLPAACAAHDTTLEALRDTGRWLTVEGVPLMSDQQLVRGFIKLYGDHRPDIVLMDTLAAAMAGLNEDSAETGAMLTSNGPVGLIARTWKATVMLAHHTGKDITRLGRGTSAFHGNSDFYLLLEADKANKISTVTVDKMRGGPSGFRRYFEVVDGLGGIGVARPIEAVDAHRRKQRTNPGRKAQNEVLSALLSLDEGSTGNVLVSVSVLTEAIYQAREGARVRKAEDERTEYEQPDEEAIEAEKKNIQKNLIYPNASVTTARGGKKEKPATLEPYIAKDRNGDRLTPLQFYLPKRGDTGSIALEADSGPIQNSE